MGLTKCPFITYTQMKHTRYTKETFYIMLLLPNCEVHTGKYLDRSFEARTEGKSKVQIFAYGPHNWSIRAILYS